MSPRTILVVDDQPMVLGFLVMLLERAGYRVLAAATAEEALAFEREDEPIDLLLTDVMMPGITGLELAKVLGELRPGLRVLLISGNPDEFNQVTRWRFLEKPFTAAGLLRAVREALGEADREPEAA